MMTKKMIPHSSPTIGKDEIKAVSNVISSGQIAQGREVAAFEDEFAQRIGVKYAAAVNSGTAALHLALIGLTAGPGDEIVIPSYVCTALLNAVNYTGATPVVADIDPVTLNIAPDDVATSITPQTRAVIVPHMFGLPADMEKLGALGIHIIEDCAQAVGSAWGGQAVGSIGKVGIFSFYATKMMTCGEGGMVVSNSREVIERVREAREYDNREDYAVRFNYKMTDVQAAMGRIQLKTLAGFIARRREIAGLYRHAFKDLDIELPLDDGNHVFYRYNIRVRQDVDGWLEAMQTEGVACARPVFKPLHRYLHKDNCPATDQVHQTALSIPVYPLLTDEDAKRVADAVARIADRIKA